MKNSSDLINDLTILNQIIESINRTVDVRGVMGEALARLLDVMGLETGWIFLKDPVAVELWAGRGYTLAAHLNLPPALALDNPEAWNKGCDCQGFCDRGKLTEAYNEVSCSRLEESHGDRRGLIVHASVPLRSGQGVLGILNVAAPDWSAFDPEALALLTNVGNQMGAALERARLYDLLSERRIYEQQALLDLGNQLLCCLDLPELLDHLAVEVPRLLGSDACALLLHDPEDHDLCVQASRGWNSDPLDYQGGAPGEIRMALDSVVHDRSAQMFPDLAQSRLPTPLVARLRAEGFLNMAFAPLITEGEPLGVILLNSRRPWSLDDNEVRFLQLLVNQAAFGIERARLHEAELAQQRLEAELDMGREIQTSMLPKRVPVVPGWEFAVYYRLARQVGGDFYDFFELPGGEGRWGLVVADVVDKGVPAALYMALCRTIIRTASISGRRAPAEALRRVNTLVRRDRGLEGEGETSDDATFVSAVYAALDTRTGQLTYTNAGHNRPLWVRASSGRVDQLSARGIVLGLLDEIELEQRQVTLAPGDSLVFYTDGVTEAMDTQGKAFGDRRLGAALAAHAQADAQGLLAAVVEAVQAFTGDAPQSDDLTMFVVKRM